MPPRLPTSKTLYKRLIKSAFVGALRAVFTEEYRDNPRYANLQVVQDFNLQQIEFPMIVVSYQGDFTENIGIGHSELWLTHRGYEVHGRRRWEGRVTFDIYARTPGDRDELFDALTGLLAFGRLERLLGNFFDYLFFHDVGVDYQIMLNEDTQHDKGDSMIKPWWLAEDYAIFTGGITMECHGTFASVVEDVEDTMAFVNKIIVYPYIYGYEDAPDPDPLVVWVGTTNSEDNGYVNGEGVLSSIEEFIPGL